MENHLNSTRAKYYVSGLIAVALAAGAALYFLSTRKTIELVDPVPFRAGRVQLNDITEETWDEYSINPSRTVAPQQVVGDLRVDQPRFIEGTGAMVFIDPAGEFHGTYTKWYAIGGPRTIKAAELDFDNGNAIGTITIWDVTGRIKKQYVVGKSVQEAPPWLNGKADQIVPDGLYTTWGRTTNGATGNSMIGIRKQWRVSNGVSSEAQTSGTFEKPHGIFWAIVKGMPVSLSRGAAGPYLLDERVLKPGDTLTLRFGKSFSTPIQCVLVQGELGVKFLNKLERENIEAGQEVQYLHLKRGVSLSWQ